MEVYVGGFESWLFVEQFVVSVCQNGYVNVFVQECVIDFNVLVVIV